MFLKNKNKDLQEHKDSKRIYPGFLKKKINTEQQNKSDGDSHRGSTSRTFFGQAKKSTRKVRSDSPADKQKKTPTESKIQPAERCSNKILLGQSTASTSPCRPQNLRHPEERIHGPHEQERHHEGDTMTRTMKVRTTNIVIPAREGRGSASLTHSQP